jgi:hypothetical protein
MKTCLGLLFFEIPENTTKLTIESLGVHYRNPLTSLEEKYILPTGEWEIVGEIRNGGIITFKPSEFLTLDDDYEGTPMYFYPNQYYSHITHIRYLSGSDVFEVFKAHMEHAGMFITNPLNEPLLDIPFKSPGNYTENDYQRIASFNKRKARWLTIESNKLKTGYKYLVIKRK